MQRRNHEGHTTNKARKTTKERHETHEEETRHETRERTSRIHEEQKRHEIHERTSRNARRRQGGTDAAGQESALGRSRTFSSRHHWLLHRGPPRIRAGAVRTHLFARVVHRADGDGPAVRAGKTVRSEVSRRTIG